MTDQPLASFRQGVDSLLHGAQAYAPRLLAAILLVVVGVAIAWLIATLARRSLELLGVDRVAANTHWLELDKHLVFDARPSRIAARLVHWLVLFLFVVAAVDTLGLGQLSAGLGSGLVYLPEVIGGAFLTFLGLWAAAASRNLVVRRSKAIAFDRADLLGRLVHGALLVLTSVLVLAQFGLETTLLRQAILVVLACFGVTVAIAFGMGARDIAASLVAGGYLRETYSPGDQLSVGGVEGRLRQIGTVTSVLETVAGQVCIPNKVLLSSVTNKSC